MRKFLFHRIGVADDQSDNRPTLHDCIDIVLTQTDTLIDEVIEGLAAAAKNTKEKGGFGGQTPLSSTVTDLLSSQAAAIKKTFTAQLRQCVYQSEPQDVVERPLVRFEDLQLLRSEEHTSELQSRSDLVCRLLLEKKKNIKKKKKKKYLKKNIWKFRKKRGIL